MQLSFQLHDCCTIRAVKPRRVRVQYEVVANRTANALQAPSKTTARSHAVKENVPVQIIFRKSHQLVPKAKSTLLPTIFKRQPSKFKQKRFCGCFAADTNSFRSEAYRAAVQPYKLFHTGLCLNIPKGCVNIPKGCVNIFTRV